MHIMRTHVNITEEILGTDVDETTKRIALRHHEKLDGSGYPGKLTGRDLTKGERIVAVADIVSALTGTRSYKDAYPKEKVVSIIEGMRRENTIDAECVSCMVADYEGIMEHTLQRCQPILDAYYNIKREYLENDKIIKIYRDEKGTLKEMLSAVTFPSGYLLLLPVYYNRSLSMHFFTSYVTFSKSMVINSPL